MCPFLCVCLCACKCAPDRVRKVYLCVCAIVFTLVVHARVSWWNLQLQVVTTHKGSCQLASSGPNTLPQKWQTPATHTTLGLTALWARRMRAWFTANELGRGGTLENHHLQCMVLCDVPIKEDHCYKWSNLYLPVIRKTPVRILWSKLSWSGDTFLFVSNFY